METAKLQILHDHYKETFSYIRFWEKHRDLLFLALIGIIGLLFLEVQYPVAFLQCVKKVNATCATIDINALPIPIITSATWTIFLAIMLRYCQSTMTVDRQYRYLHNLEKTMSSFFGGSYLYQREGHEYNWDYPIFSSWVYIFYVCIFPIIVIGLQAYLILSEHKSPIGYFVVYDVIMASSVLISLTLYRGAQVVNALFCKDKKRGE